MSNFLQDVCVVLLTLTLCTVLGFALNNYSPLHRVDIAMVFLLGVVAVSLKVKSKIALLMPIMSVGTFILFFVPPGLAVASGKTGYVVTLLVMFSVAVMISGLVDRLRLQEIRANDSLVALEIEQLRGQLLSSVSHDLRAPLASIAGAASSLIAADFDKNKRHDLAKSIFDQTNRLNRVLKNLLDITRFENHSMKPHNEWNDIEELIGVALNQLEVELSSFDVQLEIPSNLPLFYVDGVLVEQLLLNLLDNAAKYSEGDKDIAVKVGWQEARLVIAVENCVVDFSREVEKSLFQKFFRAQKHEHMVGSGLGLSICKAIAELHNGSIIAKLMGDRLSLIATLPVAHKTIDSFDVELVEKSYA